MITTRNLERTGVARAKVGVLVEPELIQIGDDFGRFFHGVYAQLRPETVSRLARDVDIVENLSRDTERDG